MATAKQDYDTTCYQVVYFAADSFKDATEKMIKFADTLDRPFLVSYNNNTKTVQVSIRPDFDSDFTKSKPRKGEVQLANKAWC
jgi:Biopterin-dependent aromatic amino acid hydroxylase